MNATRVAQVPVEDNHAFTASQLALSDIINQESHDRSLIRSAIVLATHVAQAPVEDNHASTSSPPPSGILSYGSHGSSPAVRLLPSPRNPRLIHRTQLRHTARAWWKTNKGKILASTQFVLETVEKGLDGMPVPGPKAAAGAIAGIVKAIKVCLPR
jgi:hypothetical protein